MGEMENKWSSHDELIAENPHKVLVQPRWIRDGLAGYQGPAQPTMEEAKPPAPRAPKVTKE